MTMTAVRLHGAGDLRPHEEPVPVASAGESLVRVGAVGLCGSDLHWFEHGTIGDAQLSTPLVPGHEFAGVVTDGPLAGRLVAVDPARPCGSCRACIEGHRNLCPTVRFAGHGTNDGALREFLAWPTDLLYPVPAGFTAADAAMLEPLGVAVHAYDLGKVPLGGTVAVVGCGPIGLCLVQLARAAGATRVVAVEPLEHRRAAATDMGADLALAPGPEAEPELAAATGGDGVDVAFEVAGEDAAVALSVVAARPGGTVVLAGIPATDDTSFPASIARRKGLTLKLSRRMKEVYPRAIALVDRGLVDVRSLVTHTYPLDRSEEAFQVATRREGLKVLITP